MKVSESFVISRNIQEILVKDVKIRSFVCIQFCAFGIVPIRKTAKVLQNEPMDVEKVADTADNEVSELP
jgi:hypothetical protein